MSLFLKGQLAKLGQKMQEGDGVEIQTSTAGRGGKVEVPESQKGLIIRRKILKGCF